MLDQLHVLDQVQAYGGSPLLESFAGHAFQLNAPDSGCHCCCMRDATGQAEAAKTIFK
jgi:hypothetical protein